MDIRELINPGVCLSTGVVTFAAVTPIATAAATAELDASYAVDSSWAEKNVLSQRVSLVPSPSFLHFPFLSGSTTAPSYPYLLTGTQTQQTPVSGTFSSGAYIGFKCQFECSGSPVDGLHPCAAWFIGWGMLVQLKFCLFISYFLHSHISSHLFLPSF